MTITDDLGRGVSVPIEPKRIVSLSPSFTEILFALGIDEELVGVTEYCDYPPAAIEKQKVGGFATVSTEKVVALKPDLVLANARLHKQIVEGLEDLGLTVVALYAEDVDAILEHIKLIGNITGRSHEAKKLTDDMKSRMEDITARVKGLPKPKVFYVSWHEPLKTAGPGTYAHDLIHLAGGINIASDAGTKYPVYSLEVLIERNPEIIIVSTGHGEGGPTVEAIKSMLHGKGIDAIENNLVCGVHTSLTGRASPRIIDGLEEMATCIHPEL
jgi:iron complex transport system substrate-binding protein